VPATEELIQQALANPAAVKALIQDRVYPGLAPQDSAFPRVEWQVLASTPDIAHDGRTRCDRYVIEIRCAARTSQDLNKLRQTIEAAIDPPAVLPIGLAVALKQDEYDRSEFTASGSDQRIKSVILQYAIWLEPGGST
jgi:hypothetical protein